MGNGQREFLDPCPLPLAPKMGRLYGIGVGPGDPELLTLRAHRLLRGVPVVCVPKKGTHERSYALSIVREVLDPSRQEIMELVFPMKKDLASLAEHWQAALEQVALRLRAGKDVAFITEGDPLLFGTFIYLFNLVRERHPDVEVEIVPGISSINAASARAGVPLADGEGRLAVLPATYEWEGLRRTLQEFDCTVLLKVSSVFDRVLDILEELGLADRAVYVKKCGTAEEEVVRDIRSLRGAKLDYLSLLIVRK